MFSVNYSHFTTEHNHNHHKWVATEQDPASAREEEGLWLFWARTIPGQFASSVRVNARKGRPGLRNPSYQWLAAQFAVLLYMFSLPHGHIMAIGWLGLSGIAILTLEYVNYIRHWGLRRGREERQTEMHSWNTEARWSRWSLLELTRHSGHHLRASTPFWQLRPHPAAPELPGGYYACWWPGGRVNSRYTLSRQFGSNGRSGRTRHPAGLAISSLTPRSFSNPVISLRVQSNWTYAQISALSWRWLLLLHVAGTAATSFEVKKIQLCNEIFF